MRKLTLILSFLLTLAVYAQHEVEVVCIENPAVYAYMADTDTTYVADTDFGHSVILKYKNNDLYGPNLDWPAGKYVEWKSETAPEEIDEIRITVSEHKNFRDSITHFPDTKADSSFVIRNTIPDRRYYYKVEEFTLDGRCQLLTKGSFKTVGQVRMIQVRGAHNVRDLGGWDTCFGVPIQYGYLYRSASLDAIKANGRHDFAYNLGVGAELDLRGESKLTSSKLGAECDFMRLAHETSSQSIDSKKHLFVQDLTWIIERLREGKSVDWHCAIGCDRTGVLTCLIEGLLGMSEMDMARDYELSTFAWQKINRPRSPIRHMCSIIRKYGPADDLQQCFYNYWVEIGIPAEDLDYFICLMLGMPM